MKWADINLLLFIISFAVGSMTLCLAVLYHLRTQYEWTKYYIVFQISITVLLIIQSLSVYMSSALQVSGIVRTVVLWILIIDIAFMIFFVPYFSTWIIAHPWRNPFKSVFLALSIIFIALAVVGTVLSFPPWTRLSLGALFLGVFFFTLGVLLKHIRDIRDPDARMVSLACISLSLFMVPFVAVDLAVSFDHLATMPVYYFWFSLIIFIYLFNYFRRQSGPARAQLSEELMAQFHVTGREREVIRLISEGLASKEIADELHISISTVNNHIANIYQKTHVSSRIDLLNLLMRR